MSDCDRLRRLMAEVLHLPKDAITDGMTLLDTESWDSFAHLELIVAIESEFAVNLSVDEIPTMTSFTAIRDTLAGRGVKL